ncbi:MAG: divalent metal cation transporter, partial [Candidatus Eremiobacteraeota bacterium]|nr:divalent metal cation transporter [Candidatus Eremiobacteraeota bacterium]
MVGMLVAGTSFLFILIATAATSGKHHVTVQTAADAAAALRPLAGAWDQRLFGLGLFASAAIAVPIIAATNGYVVAQTLGAPAGLALVPSEARVFYRAIFGSLAVAAIGALLPIPTIALLFWVSVAAGIATPLTLALTVLVAADRAVMRDRPIGPALAVAGWTVTGCVTLASIVFLASAARLLS